MTNSNNALEKLRYRIQVEIDDIMNDVHLPSKTFYHGRVNSGYINEVRRVEHPEIQDVYSKTCSLRELFNKYGLKPQLARNALAIAGIDFPADLAAEYHAEKSIGYLAKNTA